MESTNTNQEQLLPFVAVTIPGQRTVHSKVFPLALALPDDGSYKKPSEGAEYLQRLGRAGILTQLMRDHGAVLFRGFGSPSAETFSSLVNAAEVSRGSKPFEQIGLAGRRHHLAKEVFTANEGPPDRRFYQHNEVKPSSSNG